MLTKSHNSNSAARIPIDGKRIFDSDQVHCLEEVPRDLVIVGAGIIGLEYASMFASLGVKVTLLDQRPINNAVDATNYVLWESGKPTHVYDLDLLEGSRIVVRFARSGETLKTLDGVERKLTTEDLVVADAKRPVGLANLLVMTSLPSFERHFSDCPAPPAGEACCDSVAGRAFASRLDSLVDVWLAAV